MKRGQRFHHDKYGRDWRAIAMLLLVSALRLLTYSVTRGWNTQLMTMTTNDDLRTSRLSAPGDTLTLRWMPERNCERFAP